MKQEIKELYPNWIHDIKTLNRNVTLSNDLDSLISCCLLDYLFGLKINYFYDFRSISQLDHTDIRNSIGVDIALKNGLCFDNHLTRLTSKSYVNEQSANINVATGGNWVRYTDKFAMSTLIQIWSLYDLPLPSSYEGKMILLCTDVGFKGFYDSRFKATFLNYLEQLEMMELVELLETHTIEEMYDFYRKNLLHTGIEMYATRQQKGELYFTEDSLIREVDVNWISEHLGFPVALPQGSFETITRFKTKKIEPYELHSHIEDAFSFAFINMRTIMISMKGESA